MPVTVSSTTLRAMPKSSSFSVPVLSNITFCGLMSRCVICSLWTAASPETSARKASIHTDGPERDRLAMSTKVGPSTTSITRKIAPVSVVPVPKTEQTCSSRTDDAWRISRARRAAAALSLGTSPILSATSRCSTVSNARYTTPMPPFPRRRRRT